MKSLNDFSLDLLESLSDIFDDADRWDHIVSRLREFGFNALNMVCFTPKDSTIHWARCSMDPAWLDEYTNQSYAGEDELLAQVYDGTEMRLLEAGKSNGTSQSSATRRAYHAGLYRAGYRYLHSLIVPCPEDEAKLVVLASERDDIRDIMANDPRAMRILSTVLATNLGSETESTFGRVRDMTDVARERPNLSPRETEVLILLGSGMRNDQIAHTLDLSEVTIRNHLQSARKKLDVPTREAALVRAVQMGLVKISHHRNR